MMNAKDLQELANNTELIELARLQIESLLIVMRDTRTSEPGRGDGLVIRERNGDSSDIIRMGIGEAIQLGMRTIAKHLEEIRTGVKEQTESDVCDCGLQAIVDKLPKTLDGVMIVPGIITFRIDPSNRIIPHRVNELPSTNVVEKLEAFGVSAGVARGAYSTREAAEAAKQQQNETEGE